MGICINATQDTITICTEVKIEGVSDYPGYSQQLIVQRAVLTP